MNDYTLARQLLSWTSRPTLNEPILVAGFLGWSNAGNVSGDTVTYLLETLEPDCIASLSDEPFMNYALDRPVAQIGGGLIQSIESTRTEIHGWSNDEGDNDLVVLLGNEPHCMWRSYVDVLLELCDSLGIKRVITIGGVQDAVSHTGPVVISAVATDEGTLTALRAVDPTIQPADYYGPISVHSFLIQRCAEAGISGVSLWGHVPAYLQKNPRLVASLVRVLNSIVGMRCPVGELDRESLDMERRIQEAIHKDPELRKFVDTVEGRQEETKLSSVSTDKVIRLNDFLRKDDPDR
jgi:proteasome assembly chaperone (PAC2) family protein